MAGIFRPRATMAAARPICPYSSSVRACTATARDVVPGSEVLSTIRTGTPSRASHSANTRPVGPAPTIRTSVLVVLKFLCSRCRVDQREPRFRVEPAMQVPRCLGHHDLERWTHHALDEVPAMRGRIGLANNDLRVHFRFVLLDADVADERKDFHLGINPQIAIRLRRPVEIGHDDSRERTDGSEMTPPQVL